MKVTFEFDTNNPDDRIDLEVHRQAPKMQSVLFEFNINYRRQFLKRDLTDDQREIVEEIFNQLNEEIIENNINLDM